MAELGSHHCHTCNMVFRSYALLEKHKEKFCIGSHISDPTVLSSSLSGPGDKRHLYGRGVPRIAETPDFRMRDSIAHLKAKENLLNEREQQLVGGYGQSSMASDSVALKSLTDEFYKLRKSLEDSVPTLRSLQFQGETSPHMQWDREYRGRMQEMAEAHGRHLADIQTQNQVLELQREEIRQRLSEFTSSGSATSHIEQMLLELKAQEEKNQLALDALRDQVVLIQSESRAKAEKTEKENPPSSAVKQEKAPLNLLALSLHGGNLSSEISALQLAYVQSGGNDPSVLAQLKALQAEAMITEGMAHKLERKERKRKKNEGPQRALDMELMAVEMENQRLEEEIFKLKLQRDKKRDNGEAEIADMHKEHLQQMAKLQADMQLLRQEVTRMPPRPMHGPPPFLPPPVAPHLPPPMHPTRIALGRPEATIMMDGLDSMRPHSASRHILDPPDALGPAPYDPVAGFVIFYDYLLGLEPTLQKLRVVSGLYSNGHRMGQATSLPDVLCEMWHSSNHLTNAPRGNVAMLSTKQPIPRVRPGSAIALVMELQASGGFNSYGQGVQRLLSCGWTKLDLFDQHNQVLSGRWKLPVRALPLRPGLSIGQLNTIPQVGKAELFIRVVNARDADIQSMAEIDPKNASLYQYPPMMSVPAAPVIDNPAPQTDSFHHSSKTFNLPLFPYTDYVDPPPVQELPTKDNQSDKIMEDESFPEQNVSVAEKAVGFIIYRVKGAPLGDGTMRLTGYRMKTGQVIDTKGSGMNAVLSAVSSSIKRGYFVFGEQEMIFRDVTPKEDMVLMLRFYHWPGGSAASAPWKQRRSLMPLLATEEWAAAWAVVRLSKPVSRETQTDSDSLKAVMFEWNTGIHELALYHNPAPPAIKLSTILPEHYGEAFEQYGSATVRICIFNPSGPDLPFPPESPLIHSHIQEVFKDVYIPLSRSVPVSAPYSPTDTIALYIDGARFLPDAVTITRVTGRIFDKSYDQIGPDISTGIDLNSDIFHPVYNYNVQIRASNIPPTATLLLKVYTIDRFTQQPALVGWAALNLFVQSGTQKAPTSDSGEAKISLNEGAFQIRVYHRQPPTDQPLSVHSLASTGRVVPCVSLLVRVLKVPGHKKQQTQEKQGNLQLTLERPEYSQGVYISDSARPSHGELQLMRAMRNRSIALVRDVIPLLAGKKGPRLVSDEHLSTWVLKTFSEITNSPQPFELCCVSRYLTTTGVKISIDRAQNLPWSGFTLAHICFNPPAAFYFGQPWSKYDHPTPVDDIDLNSYQKCPVWKDGFKSFIQRFYHEHLTIVCQLHEIVLSTETNSSQRIEHSDLQEGSYELHHGVKAWTALQVFYKNYCNLGVYQLPLYHGVPSQTALSALESGDCLKTLKNLEQTEMIQLVPGASLIVRIADGRRDEELASINPQDINQTYLPDNTIDLYIVEKSEEKLTELMPHAQKEEYFKKHLANWFRKYLYQNPTPAQDKTVLEKEFVLNGTEMTALENTGSSH